MLTVQIFKPTLIVLAGPAGSGKSTWARRHFWETAVVSSDRCRALVGDDEADMAVSRQAFALFHFTIERRLELGRLTVADSTALTRGARARLLRLARKHDFQAVVLLCDVPLATCRRRNAARERQVAEPVLRRHQEMLERARAEVYDEGFDQVFVLGEHDLDEVAVEIVPLPVEVDARGPFDIIGDVHGCLAELTDLLEKLGYVRAARHFAHPAGRTAVFLGDLADRGPYNVATILLVREMVRSRTALYIPGNHCNKLYRYLLGRQVQVRHGTERTVREIEALPADERQALREAFIGLVENAPPYLILDEGRLVVSHGGIEARMIGRLSRRIEKFCLYGDATGEVTDDGLPVRRDWARTYRGKALVVYGHTPVPEARFRDNTINIDQGCVFGGRLTALRYPEREIVQVEARAVYDERPAFRTLPPHRAAPPCKRHHAQGVTPG